MIDTKIQEFLSYTKKDPNMAVVLPDRVLEAIEHASECTSSLVNITFNDVAHRFKQKRFDRMQGWTLHPDFQCAFCLTVSSMYPLNMDEIEGAIKFANTFANVNTAYCIKFDDSLGEKAVINILAYKSGLRSEDNSDEEKHSKAE